MDHITNHRHICKCVYLPAKQKSGANKFLTTGGPNSAFFLFLMNIGPPALGCDFSLHMQTTTSCLQCWGPNPDLGHAQPGLCLCITKDSLSFDLSLLPKILSSNSRRMTLSGKRRGGGRAKLGFKEDAD